MAHIVPFLKIGELKLRAGLDPRPVKFTQQLTIYTLSHFATHYKGKYVNFSLPNNRIINGIETLSCHLIIL